MGRQRILRVYRGRLIHGGSLENCSSLKTRSQVKLKKLCQKIQHLMM